MNEPASWSPTRRLQVRLSGPIERLDPRTHAFRRDLADIALADRIAAPCYAEPVAYHCRSPRAAVYATPDPAAPMVTELLCGETFEVLEIGDDWAWGRSAHDSYVGYVRPEALSFGVRPATHLVAAPAALIFAAPDIKSAVLDRLPLNARLTLAPPEGDFLPLAGDSSGFIHRRYVRPVADPPRTDTESMLALGAAFVGTPYLWGGRTRDGIDCSGLVQALLLATGRGCPRDSDQQRAALGAPVPPSSAAAGDILFFPGHVGIMVDSQRLLHANAFWMATVVEPLADVVARLRPTCPDPILAVRRL